MAKKMTTNRDSLASVLADSLNKKFKDYKVAFFLMVMKKPQPN